MIYITPRMELKAQGTRDAMATETQQRAMQFIDMMLEQSASCRYPSKEMLDRIERAVVLFWEEEREE